jgi:hypothetical protein
VQKYAFKKYLCTFTTYKIGRDMKIPSQKLFHLVKSLSSAEKRYVKVFLGKNQVSDEKYILLFDAINRQTTLDEAQLQRATYKREVIDGTKFSEMKNYLYQTLLRILQDFDKETSINYRLQTMLGNIRVLYRRALYDECHDQIVKTQKLAETYENFEVLIELLRWGKQIAHTKGDISFFSNHLQKTVNQELEYYEKLENIAFYKNAFYEVYAIIRKQGLLGRDKMVAALSDTMAKKEFKNKKYALSKTAQILFYRTKSIYAYALGAHEKFYEDSRELLILMESYEEYMHEETNEYISALNNFIASCFALNRFREVNIMLEKLRNVVPRTFDDRVKIHRQYYQSKLQWCINTASFEEGMKVIKEREKEKESFDNQELIHSGFHYPYFYISFAVGEYDLANDYLNEWLGATKTTDRQDLQVMARLLSLILHFEMGNSVLIDSLLRTTSYYLSRHDSWADFERLLLRFIREAYQSSSKKELADLLEAIKKDFEKLAEDSTQSVFTQYFDFIAWLESKISGKSFAQTLKDKLKDNI